MRDVQLSSSDSPGYQIKRSLDIYRCPNPAPKKAWNLTAAPAVQTPSIYHARTAAPVSPTLKTDHIAHYTALKEGQLHPLLPPLSFLALRRERLPFHYGRCGPQRPQTFSKRQPRLRGGASQQGKHLGPNPPTTSNPSPRASPLHFTSSATGCFKWETAGKYSASRFLNPIAARRTPPPPPGTLGPSGSEPNSAPPPRPHPPRQPLSLAELGTPPTS